MIGGQTWTRSRDTNLLSESGFFGNNQIIFYNVEVEDDEDLQDMFSSHVYSG